MNKTQLLALYDQDQRIDVLYPDVRREALPHLVRHTNLTGRGEGMVIYSHLTEDTTDAAIREQIAYFEDTGQDFEWKVYSHDRPPDLQERLVSHGFTVEAADAIMVLDLEEAPPSLMQPPAHPIKRITDAAGIADVLQIETAVWNEDFSDLGQYLSDTLQSYPKQLSAYIACVDDIPVSAAWIYFPPNSRFASLWGGSTLDTYRGQGIYTALLAVRTQGAIERGLNYLTVDASPMSRPILERFGFLQITYAHACKWKVPRTG